MIKLINHACLSVETEKNLILFDPWFFGKIFNNSWSLLKETKLNSLNLSNLTHIFISHEHPDHLHFPTLKSISELKKGVNLIFPYRKDLTVKRILEGYGYNVTYIAQNTEIFEVEEDLKIRYFSNKNEGDHTISIEYFDKVLINQNDHYTDNQSIRLIKSIYPKIDVLFTQFSLAGYYGNKDEPESIMKNGHDWHLNRLSDYNKIFDPKVIIPFASFVYFCKETNKYLNRFTVNPKEVFNLLGDKCKFVLPGDDIFINQPKKTILDFYNDLFDLSNKNFTKPETINFKELTKTIKSGLQKINLFLIIKRLKHKSIILLYFLKPLKIRLSDSNKFIKISFLKNKVIECDQTNKYDFCIPCEELDYMMKYPWGADTANITGTVSFYSKRAKYFFMILLLNYKSY